MDQKGKAPLADEETEVSFTDESARLEENRKLDEQLNKIQQEQAERLKRQREELQRLRTKFPETFAKISSET